MTRAERRRCATYTRKSSEEGLEQDFNSLDAQREACEAYIKSQASEGWKPVRMHYDDGGHSGGTLARPALERLLADIEAVPRGVLYYRQLTQWFGGMGLIVLAVAVLPALNVGGLELIDAEAGGAAQPADA